MAGLSPAPRLARTGMNGPAEPVLHAKRHYGLWHGRLRGIDANGPALGNRGGDEHELHPRERLADAAPGSPAEWEIRKGRQPGLEFRRPAIRPKTGRLREPARISLRDVGADQNESAVRQD